MSELNIKNSEQTTDLTQLKINKLLKRHKIFKITVIVVTLVVLICCIGVFFYSLAENSSYDIMAIDRGGNLTLSFDPEFKTGYSVITAHGTEKMSGDEGGTYSEIEDYVNAIINGEVGMNVTKNGQDAKAQSGGSDDYSVAKLYLKNQTMTGDDVIYKLKINIYDNKREAFSAARIMVCMIDGGNVKKTVYAQPGDDGTNEKVATSFRGADTFYKDELGLDWICESFKKNKQSEWYYDSLEMKGVTYTLKPQQSQEIVIAVWYEGSDKNHTDKIVGGSYSLSVIFETIN